LAPPGRLRKLGRIELNSAAVKRNMKSGGAKPAAPVNAPFRMRVSILL
jgi:hypothetical protein